jgi:hypothetical protein
MIVVVVCKYQAAGDFILRHEEYVSFAFHEVHVATVHHYAYGVVFRVAIVA